MKTGQKNLLINHPYFHKLRTIILSALTRLLRSDLIVKNFQPNRSQVNFTSGGRSGSQLTAALSGLPLLPRLLCPVTAFENCY